MPQYVPMDYDPLEPPNVESELLGRGSRNRKTKTYIKDQQLAVLLGHCANHSLVLREIFRKSHARWHTREVTVELEDGRKTTRVEPEVLTDDELADRYPVIKDWEDWHQEQVDHYASIGGFSVNAAVRGRSERREERREVSSAGADRNGREEARWR
jgi:hypothetical protein